MTSNDRIQAATDWFNRNQGGRIADIVEALDGSVVIHYHPFGTAGPIAAATTTTYRVHALDIDTEIERMQHEAKPHPTYDELAAENAKLRSVLAQVRADRPSTHSDDVWTAINDALGGR